MGEAWRCRERAGACCAFGAGTAIPDLRSPPGVNAPFIDPWFYVAEVSEVLIAGISKLGFGSDLGS
jgi:hypothetical protein